MHFQVATTSAFNSKGKKSAWQVYEDVTETSMNLAGHPFLLLDVEDKHFEKLERLTVKNHSKKVHRIIIRQHIAI